MSLKHKESARQQQRRRQAVHHGVVVKSAHGKTLRIDSAPKSEMQPAPDAVPSATESSHRKQTVGGARGKVRVAEKKTSRVQVRLSKSLVRILVAFQKAGQNPSHLTERCLWNDKSVRDAALLLGISPAVLRGSTKSKPESTKAQ